MKFKRLISCGLIGIMAMSDRMRPRLPQQRTERSRSNIGILAVRQRSMCWER